MSIRDLRARARGALHGALSVPAVHIAKADGAATPCTVRYHDRTSRMGDLTGFDYGPVERTESTPEIVALFAEVQPRRGDLFSVASDEAYRVETPLPRDGITVTCEVTKLSQTDIDAAALPVPGS
jgi:hypothetical protein